MRDASNSPLEEDRREASSYIGAEEKLHRDWASLELFRNYNEKENDAFLGDHILQSSWQEKEEFRKKVVIHSESSLQSCDEILRCLIRHRL